MRFLLLILLFTLTHFSFSQSAEQFVNADEARGIISVLASDSLKGRGNFTKELEKAAVFIDGCFNQAGLQYYGRLQSYLQPFLYLEGPENLERIVVNRKALSWNEYAFLSPFEYPPALALKDFIIKSYAHPVPVEQLTDSLAAWQKIDTPILLLVPGGERLLRAVRKGPMPFSEHVRLILAEKELPETLSLFFKPELRKRMLFNVLGFLPGRSKPEEIVMITAHYDHVGLKTGVEGDSVFNGANDNASGTAAMLMLAKYFANRGDNERSLLFVAFAGEEIGLVGSTYLSNWLNVPDIVAQVNLEMLGKPAGEKRSCIVTGEGELPDYFMKTAKKAGIRVRPDRFPAEKLFVRSDNFPFAGKKVPAHTFMMFLPGDPDYHQLSDEIGTLDLENMAEVVRGLIPGIEGLASRKFTPKRL